MAAAGNPNPLAPKGSALWRYGLAIVSIAMALGLARTFLYFQLPQPFAVFALSAIAVTFWYGGTKPGILAALLAVIVRNSYEPAVARVGAIPLALYDLSFVVFALLMTLATRARNELELRVAERTVELTRSNEELKREIADHIRDSERLRQVQDDLARISRVTTMGELTASLAHEVNQPIAAAVTNANTCLRWLTRTPPDVEEARAAASRLVKDATRAADIVSRIRLLFKKGTPERELVDISEVVREMLVLLRNETSRYSISIRAEIASNMPRVMADRVQLQQVFMNLMMNGIDAMKNMNGERELTIRSRQENGHVLISVSDTGVGLPPQQADQIFDAFFTTKDHGTGMGLSISRSILESHGGRLWAVENSPRGASFCFTLPTDVVAQDVSR